jgi:hypothetical protein
MKRPGEEERVIRTEKDAFIENLLFRIHLITEKILIDRPCAMGV